MEAAAEKIRQLSQTVLPQFPHQLLLNHNWKCRHLPGSDRCEEWHIRPLQYMTLVSVADRGLLITRGYMDVRPDPDPPVPLPKEVNALAKGGGEKKKLSLSDYMNKKSGATISVSPPEPSSLQAKKDRERERSISATVAVDSKTVPRDDRKSDATQSGAELCSTARPYDEDQDGAKASNQKLPPKPASLPPRPPTPDTTKKRTTDGDDSRATKRVKGSEAAQRLAEDNNRLQVPRDEARRRKEGLLPHETPRESKSGSLLVVNGRHAPKPTSTNRSTSPLPTGHLRGSNGKITDSGRASSIRSDAAQKASVPPLLSPLNFELEGNRDRPGQKLEKRRRDEAAEVAKPSKTSSKQDGNANSTTKKVPNLPSRPHLPALLSPTLPPEIEAELDRVRQSSQKSSEGPKKDSHIFSFKIPKRLRQDMRRILAITSSRKEPQRPSSSGGVGPQMPAKKRPVNSGERELGDSLASKRPRTSDISRASVLPSTPLKKNATAMSRVSSSNSAAYTPGDAVTSTPSQLATNGEPRTAAELSRIEKLREKEASLLSLGKRLKRHGDLAMKGRSDPVTNGGGGGGGARVVESAVISGYISITESIVAFMSAFDAQDSHRSLSNKGLDPSTWTSLLPLLDFLQKDMRRYDAKRLRPLSALLCSIQGVAYDHIVTSYALCDNQQLLNSLPDAAGQVRRRNRTWQTVRESNEGIDSRLLIDVRQWHGTEDIVDKVLRAMRRWCEGENIDWTPEVSPR